MNIRKIAQIWFNDNIAKTETKFRSSKLYKPEESRAREHSWWIEIKESQMKEGEFQNLLCQKDFSSSEFYHLKIPNQFFFDNKESLGFREAKESYSLIISAEPSSFMVEKRGKDKIGFKQFCVNC